MNARAFVLAAGFGTRLRPLTLHRPKPLVPVCGVSVLEQALVLCQQHGASSAVVNAHYLPDAIVHFCQRYEAMDIHVQVEAPDILGTGGGLQAARESLAEVFAVVNGDVLCDGDLGALLAACEEPEVEACMLLRRGPDAAKHGIVALDGRRRVVQLTSLAKLEGTPPVAEDTHFTGIHALRRSALERVPGQGFACIVRSAYVQLVRAGRVAGRVHPGTWLDVGNPAVYLDANLAVLGGAVALPLDPWTRVGWGLRAGGEVVGSKTSCDLHPSARFVGPCWIGPGAVVEAGAVVGPHAVVGPGSRVGRHARLECGVVWDGCVLAEGVALHTGIVHDGGLLELASSGLGRGLEA